MGRTSLTVEEIDRLVARTLDSARFEQGMSIRQLAKTSGVSATRLHALLNAERPITVGELDDIAESLSLVGWEVHRDAEEALREPLAEVRDLSELRARVEAGQVGDVAALDPGYSPEDEQEPESP